jgi:RND family efflux transporter MFP subunit
MSRTLPRTHCVFFLLAAFFFSLGCADTKADKPSGGAGPMPVQVKTAAPANIEDATEYVATLKSRDSAVVMPKQQATVKSQEDARAAQSAQVQWAEQNYERVSGLANAGVVSKQDLDQARATLDAAKSQLHALDAQVREQEVQLHYYKVLAPRSGIVGDVPVRVGDRVTTTTALTTVDRPGSLEAYIYVPVEKSTQLKVNLPVEIVGASGARLASSRITFVSPQVDNTTQTILAKAQIANAKDVLRTSQFIRARVIWGQEEKPVIPVIAVSRIGGLYFAFVAEPNPKGGYVVRQKPLRVGEIIGNDYVVLDGIKAGDKVVVSGTQFLIDGIPVVPQETSS